MVYSKQFVPIQTTLGAGEVCLHRWENPNAPAPKALFLHANGFSGFTYNDLLSRVAAHNTVLAIDLRGHGQTNLPANPADLQDWQVYTDDVIAVIEALDLSQPITISGHSMGGAIALYSAAQRPDLAASAIVIEPVLFPRGLAAIQRWLEKRTPWFEFPLAAGAQRRRAQFASRDAMFQSYRGRGAFKTWPDDILWDYIDGSTADNDDGTVRLACAPAWEANNFRTFGFPVSSVFSRLTGPVRILYADGDGSTTPKRIANHIRTRYKNVEVECIAGAGHFLPMQKPERMADEIGDWLTQRENL